jgi:hypothetical protein
MTDLQRAQADFDAHLEICGPCLHLLPVDCWRMMEIEKRLVAAGLVE